MNRIWIVIVAIAAAMIFLNSAATAAGAEQQEGLVLRAECHYDEEIPEDGSLTFVLWDGQYQILQMVVNLRQYAAFAPLHFEHDGRYVYYISQEGGRDSSVAYDPAVYQIVVEVTESAPCIAEINRVMGDCVGEAEVVEAMGAHGSAVFQNRTREIPLWAEVPQTGYRNGVWFTVLLVSAVGLSVTAKIRKTS